ncbi:MAG: Lanosterol 14-alpha-demethylase [Chrysothrix sp. TS-e1954]|nr:MAG: Lanosterol 14-alpha-demethylase [Chrysothrix sp. TS-e1954]
MGFLNAVLGPAADVLSSYPAWAIGIVCFSTFIAVSVVLNVLYQLLSRNPNEPPVVFHWFPVIGSTISYGIDPYIFFFRCREKYGDVFTFILLGRKTTVCLGTKGNDFILNAKLRDVNAEEVYTPLTTPVFGKDVVYDCPNHKLMEQKKFVKFGLTKEAFNSYVPLIAAETRAICSSQRWFPGDQGTVDVPPMMAELTIYTASRSLQGREVRSKFDSSFADLYHDLDMGFAPINFMLPWVPFPHNRRRDAANKKLSDLYLEIIKARRALDTEKDSEDMIWNLMQCVYKDGTPVPDREVAHMMIALLMAGQHSSSSTSAWILLRLAQNPGTIEELYDEQKRVLGEDLPDLTYDNLQSLTLNSQVVKETLRIHAPIHSILRQVKSPMQVEGTPYTIPTSHRLLAAPGVTSKSDEHFPKSSCWDPHRWDTPTSAFPPSEEEKDEEKIDYGYGLVSKGTGSPYLPFGAGRHRCIGEQFAYLQLGVIIASFVREVKIRNLPGQLDDIVGTDYSSLFSRPLRPARVQWERRRAEKSSEKSTGSLEGGTTARESGAVRGASRLRGGTGK